MAKLTPIKAIQKKSAWIIARGENKEVQNVSKFKRGNGKKEN